MTESATKPERKRLDWFVRKDAEQARIRITLAAETINHAQIAHHMNDQRQSGPKTLDGCASKQQGERGNVLLGNAEHDKGSDTMASRSVIGNSLDVMARILKKLGVNNRSTFVRWFPSFKVTIEGLTFQVYPADNYTERQMFFHRRLDEEASIDALRRLLDGTDGTFIDIGVNCGLYLVPITKHLGPQGRSIGYEPNPKMFERARTNISLNGLDARVRLERSAVSDTDGKMALYIHPTNFGESTLAKNVIDQTVSVDVHTVDLRRVLADNSLARPVVMKIDIEGYEPEVLGPVLNESPSENLPDAILIESANRRFWSIDLFGLFEARGYTSTFEGEGNHLFERDTPV